MAEIADSYYQAAWGNMRLWLASISTDNSRTQVVHELSSGDVHPVQDRGLRPRKTRCALLFDDNFAGETDSAIRRFRRFKHAVDSGEESVFTHPIDGTYFARVGEFTYDINDDGVITNVQAEFIATADILSVAPAAAGTNALTGEGSITAAADDLDTALADVDLDTDATGLARIAQQSWADDASSEDGLAARDVFVDVGSISAHLAALIDNEGLEDSLSLWESYRCAILFGDAVRTSAIAATAETPSVFVLRVGLQPISLLVLCARIYGGADAQDRYRQVLGLNDIKRPAWIDPGTQLLMPTPPTAPRSNLALRPGQ